MFAGTFIDSHSPQAASIAQLFGSFIYIAAGIFLLVAVLVTVAAVRFRDRGKAELPFQRHGNARMEFAWILASFGILAVLLTGTARVMYTAEPSREPGVPDLFIVGHQWWWEARYPNSTAVSANQIHIPLGTRWLVQINSADVIHDFWVPQLGPKIDAVPGHTNWIWIQADRAGEYAGACSEFCGTQHASMRIQVVAEARVDFDRWKQQQAAPAQLPASDDARTGAQVFAQRNCGRCHTIRGSEHSGAYGPDLTHVGSKVILESGLLPNTPQALTSWLRNFDSIKPGAHRIGANLTAPEASALAAYLGGLQ